MRAARIYEYGGPEVFKVEDEVPEPEVRPGDVLVRVHAAAVNPVDWKMRYGHYRVFVRYKLPVVMGLDISGVVEQVGAKVTAFAPGDEVFATPHYKRAGGYGELVALDAKHVAKKPSNITHAEAAGLPLAGLTAWQCLKPLEPGGHALIQAGSGGVGSLAVQIAKARGATVAATCSGRNADFVAELGADEVIDYTLAEFDAHGERRYDFCLDAIGGDQTRRCVNITRRGGSVASITPGLPALVKKYGPVGGFAAVGLRAARNMTWAKVFRGVSLRMVTMKSRGAELAELAALIEAGSVRPIVDKVFPLDDITEAHRYSETGRARGKIVLDLT